jgi:hypothetical protein
MNKSLRLKVKAEEHTFWEEQKTIRKGIKEK